MMRSLYSGVSGLKVHQTKMDVIGNNISNVNTVGFKSSSVTFTDVFYQTTQAASGPNAETGMGGTNAKQIGIGSSLGAITTNIKTQGGSQRTDNPFDMMISGESFSIVSDGVSNYFTKAGNFNVDANGTLVTSSGKSVMGWRVDSEGEVIRDRVKSLPIMSEDKMKTPPEATTKSTVLVMLTARMILLQMAEAVMYRLQYSSMTSWVMNIVQTLLSNSRIMELMVSILLSLRVLHREQK